MQDCSCGVAHDDNSDTCPVSLSQPMIQEALPDLSSKSENNPKAKRSDRASDLGQDTSGPSRLIEFPGNSRSMPEWRKQLSQRVREVQERKAREAAEELAAAQEAGLVSCALPSGQLELVPDLEQPVMNPIVSKALERIERARRGDHYASAGAAVATAPALATDIDELTLPDRHDGKALLSKPKLTVVAPAALVAQTIETKVAQPETSLANELTIEASAAEVQSRKPVRVISDDDVALSYLETCLSVPALSSDTRDDLPGLSRRFFGGVIDLILIALMVSPAIAAVYFSGGKWTDLRTIEIMSGITVITMFAYLTISIALTGSTLAMRMLRLRTLDLR